MNLSSLQTINHKFTIAAFDHRSSLSESLGININTEEGVAQFMQLKQLFMETFSPMCSAVLTDPVYGKASVAFKSERSGLLMSLEESGYEGGKGVVPPMLENWGVIGVKGFQAAAKLLLYFNPDEPTAKQKIELTQRIFEESKKAEVPFLLEPVLYAVEDEQVFKDNWMSIQRNVVEVFDDFCDVLKIEYPGLYASNESEARSACEQISQYASKPWIILSRGMKYETFKKAVQISLLSGGAGFAVGRAVWQEIEQWGLDKTKDWQVSFSQIKNFLETTGKQRMVELVELVVE